MKNLYFYLPLFIFFINACTSDKKIQDTCLINIDLDQIWFSNSEVSIFDYFSKIELVPLETKEASLIGRMNKLLEDSNHYFIFDKDQSAIFIFDKQGKFLHRIRNIGKGPGEYMLIYDFEINMYTQQIELLEPFGAIYCYDFDGNFKQKITLPSSIPAYHNMVILDEDIILLVSHNIEKKFQYYSRKANTIFSETYSYPESINTSTAFNPNIISFQHYGKEVIYAEMFTYKTFTIKDRGIVLRYSWDYGKHNFDIFNNLPKGPDHTSYSDFEAKIAKYAYPRYLDRENGTYIYSNLLFQQKPVNIFYNKREKTYKAFNKYKEGVAFIAQNFEDAYVLSYGNVAGLHYVVNEKVLDDKNRVILKSITENDNPVIIKYTFK